ncbi:MAG: DUF4270 family protein [Marinilabiliaceae bacterium]|nr:DUF4270 family protein [Marinilabiliaceae bacterium]
MNKISLKHTFNHLAGQFFIIGLLSLSVSCKDDPAKLGGDGVLPEGDEITAHSYNSYPLITETTTRKEIRTSDANYGVLGSFDDPTFGNTEAGFAFNISIGAPPAFKVKLLDPNDLTNPDKAIDTTFYKFDNETTEFNEYWEADSVVLNLEYQYNKWYGDMVAKQTINVFELTELQGPSHEYFNTHKFLEEGPSLLGTQSVSVNNDVPDTLKNETNWNDITTGTYKNITELYSDPGHLWDVKKIDTLYNDFNQHKVTTKSWRIKLDDELAQRIFEISEEDLKTTKLNLINGIFVNAIREDASNQGWLTRIELVTFNPKTISSSLDFYVSRKYKKLNDKNEVIDTTHQYPPYSFPINKENTIVNTYEHTRDPGIDIDDPAAKQLFIQGMAGTYACLKLPDELITWVDSLENEKAGAQRKTVSNIEFFLKVANLEEVDRYPIPDRLTIYTRNDEDEIVGPPRYTRLVNGNELELEIFGSNIQDNSSGQTAGTGEKKIYASITTENETQIDSIKYQFVMRAEYFNYVMRDLADDRSNLIFVLTQDEDITYQDLTEAEKEIIDAQLLKIYHNKFANEFYIGPDAGTADFDRVILHSAAKDTKDKDRLKMNIKYFEYITK